MANEQHDSSARDKRDIDISSAFGESQASPDSRQLGLSSAGKWNHSSETPLECAPLCSWNVWLNRNLPRTQLKGRSALAALHRLVMVLVAVASGAGAADEI